MAGFAAWIACAVPALPRSGPDQSADQGADQGSNQNPSQSPNQNKDQQPPTIRRPSDPTLPPPPPPQEQDDSRARIRSTVSLVVVPVTVEDRDGELVTGLQKSDFRVFEDGIEQEISVFSIDPFPLSAAVLIDDDLKTSSAEKVQKTLETLAAGFTVSDEVSLWRFAGVPQMIGDDFITDNDVLLTQLKRIELDSSIPGMGSVTMTGPPRVNTQPLPGPLEDQIPGGMSGSHGNYKHISDAIYEAALQLSNRPSDHRKVIFLVSDGQDSKNNTHSYKDTLQLLLTNDISVYAVGVGEANLNRRITFLGNNILSKYAHATGGDIFYATSRGDLERFYPRVSEQSRNQYTVAYAPARTDRTLPYHSVEVRVRRLGLKLLCRDGYYSGGTKP